MAIIETERLVLRDFVMTDWEALDDILSDPEVTRYMHFATWDEAQRRRWLEWLVQDTRNPRRDAYNWAITLRHDSTLIGWLGIGGAMSGNGDRDFGYALNRRHWGHGYMPEAVRGVFAYEFTVLGTRHITAECETQNAASARVMQKSGMHYRDTVYDQDLEGNWAQRHRYVIDKPVADNV